LWAARLPGSAPAPNPKITDREDPKRLFFTRRTDTTWIGKDLIKSLTLDKPKGSSLIGYTKMHGSFA